MANKKEETKKVNVTTVDEDNVMEQIRKGNLMPTTLHKKVKAEMEEEEEKKKIRLLKNAIGKATLEQRRTLLQLRARRREDKITKEKLTRASELLDKLTGICSKPGDNFNKPLDEKELITPTQYKTELEKLDKDISDKISESNKTLNVELNELYNSEVGCYRYSWYD